MATFSRMVCHLLHLNSNIPGEGTMTILFSVFDLVLPKRNDVGFMNCLDTQWRQKGKKTLGNNARLLSMVVLKDEDK